MPRSGRHALAIIFIGLCLPAGFFGGLTWVNGSMRSSPTSFALVSIAVFIALSWAKPRFPGRQGEHPSLTRRTAALGLDFMFLVGLSTLAIAITAYLLEWNATDMWQWHREAFETRDTLPIIILLLSFPAIFLYFWWHAKHGKPTFGQFLMRYRIMPGPEGIPVPSDRILMGFLAVWSWPVTMWLSTRQREQDEGIHYWDAHSNTRAVFVDMTSSSVTD